MLSLSAGGMFIAPGNIEGSYWVGSRLSQIRFKNQELAALNLDGSIVHRMSLGEIGGCGVEFARVKPRETRQLTAFVTRKLRELGLSAFC